MEEKKKTAADEQALRELAKASEQYEQYLALSRVTEVAAAIEPIWTHDPSTPLTLVLK